MKYKIVPSNLYSNILLGIRVYVYYFPINVFFALVRIWFNLSCLIIIPFIFVINEEVRMVGHSTKLKLKNSQIHDD